jgi:hypothetical protein
VVDRGLYMSAMETGGAGLPAAGWYPETENPGRERLWTGERWTALVRAPEPGRTEAVPAGWYPATGHPGFERLWTGELWTEEIRRAAPTAGALPAPMAMPGGAGAVAHGSGGAPRAMVTYHDTNPPDRLGGLGTWVNIGLGATILATIARLIANQRYIGLENETLGGGLPSLAHADSLIHATHVAATIGLIVDVITAILFVIWFYRAYRNLARAGITDLRFGPGWAIGGWFIPIFGLFRQKQIANDIWKGSASARMVGIARWREIALPTLINWWWGFWILGGLAGGFGQFRIQHAHSTYLQGVENGTLVTITTAYESLRDERTGVWITQVGLLTMIVAAVLAIILVRDVSRLQDDHFETPVPYRDMIPR